jgi:acetyltransferase
VNAGVIKISNPLDLGDIYNPKAYADIFNSVLHNESVDGAVFVTQNPQMPKSDDVFYRMFKTDISKEVIGSIRSSNKPFAACLYAQGKTMSKMKQNMSIPVFDSPETMVKILKKQMMYYRKKSQGPFETRKPDGLDLLPASAWIGAHPGITGEDTLDMLKDIGIPVLPSVIAAGRDDAVEAAGSIGYPVVMKVVSPDAVHKSEAGGVMVGIRNDDEARAAFDCIADNLKRYKADARFDGVRVMAMADEGYDMFIGAHVDDSFGPVTMFGFGGIWIEVFKDVQNVICPSNRDEIAEKVSRLKSYKILEGTRGKGRGDIDGFIGIIEKISHLMAEYPTIRELDLNPVRVFADGSGVVALDARIRVES